MRLQSKPSHSFAEVPKAEIQRSSFDRSFSHKTTFDAGQLIPIYLDEALPGDTFNLQMHAFARLATPIKPIMDNMYLDTQFFAIPMRLVWDNWQKFCGERVNPDDNNDYVIPKMTSPLGGYAANSIFDYLGLPVGVAGIRHSSLFLRSLNLTWNEWYRDQNLQDSLTVPKGDSDDDPAIYSIQRRGKRHDYFTGCLPWPQKGEAVEIPLGTTAPIGFIQTNGLISPGMTAVAGVAPSSATVPGLADNALYPSGSIAVADLSQAAAATINTLRQAFQVQRMFERDARGGTRYVELLLAHFKVQSPDFRLQRPEYLGGGSTPVNINPIAQTSPTGTYANTPQGNLSAMGTVAVSGHGFHKSFTEHCIIVGFASVRADMTYQQGLNRMWSRSTRFDFYWPALSHIGEQAVLAKEIYADGTAADETVFGYQERYAEYRYKPSMITGEFRSSYPQSLDIWHLAQDYVIHPTLSPEFIEENPPIDRVIAVPTEPHFLFDSVFKLKCARPMPLYGVPGMIDHF